MIRAFYSAAGRDGTKSDRHLLYERCCLAKAPFVSLMARPRARARRQTPRSTWICRTYFSIDVKAHRVLRRHLSSIETYVIQRRRCTCATKIREETKRQDTDKHSYGYTGVKSKRKERKVERVSFVDRKNVRDTREFSILKPSSKSSSMSDILIDLVHNHSLSRRRFLHAR